MKGKRVLVTGGFGFIGSNLVHRCVALGAEVTVLDTLDPRGGGNRHNLDGVECEIEERDICDFETCASAVASQDIVFHCAALTSHAGSQQAPLDYNRTNGLGTLHVLEAMRTRNPSARLVSVGTSTQVGRMVHSPIDEKHPEFPVDFYSATKVVAEKYTHSFAKTHGLRASVVRLANTYGPRAHIRTPHFGFVNFFVGLALQNKPMPVFGDGAQLRNLSFVDDCVDALIAIAQSDQAIGEVYFATADRQHSIADIACIIRDCVGGSVSFIPWPGERKAIEVGDAVISNAKIKKVIGWAPRVSVEDGFRRTSKYYRAALEHYI